MLRPLGISEDHDGKGLRGVPGIKFHEYGMSIWWPDVNDRRRQLLLSTDCELQRCGDYPCDGSTRADFSNACDLNRHSEIMPGNWG